MIGRSAKIIWLVLVLSSIDLGQPTEYEIHDGVKEISETIIDGDGSENEMVDTKIEVEAEVELPKVELEGSIVEPVVEASSVQAPAESTVKLGNIAGGVAVDKGLFFDGVFDGIFDKDKPVDHRTKTVTVTFQATKTVHHQKPVWKTTTTTKTELKATKTVFVNTCIVAGTSASVIVNFMQKRDGDIEPAEVFAPNLATVLYDKVIKVKVYDFDPDNQLL